MYYKSRILARICQRTNSNLKPKRPVRIAQCFDSCTQLRSDRLFASIGRHVLALIQGSTGATTSI